MYLGNPLLPVNLSVKEVIADINKVMKDKHWHEFEVATLKLNLVPYFLFNYHYFVEREKGGEKIIEHSYDGIMAFNAHTISVEEKLSELIKHNWSKASTAIPDIEFEEKWNNVDKKKQEEVLQLKMAQHFNVPKENVVISSTRRVLLPFYKASVTVKEGTFGITINAVNGEMEGVEKIPEREKGFMELTKEAFNELKDPKNWLVYSKDIAVDAGGAVKKRVIKRGVHGTKSAGDDEEFGEEKKSKVVAEKVGKGLSVFSSKIVLIVIIILALLLIYIALFG